MATVITKFKVETNDYDKKIKDAQRSLDQFGLKGTEVGNKLGNLSQILTTNLGAISGLSVALGAGAAAVKVFGDALKRNEEVMDEWGRITESAGAVYDGFLNALNTGDIGGFLSNIDHIVSAARDAYDAMDELGTFNAFNQINKERTKTAFTQAIADYRTGKGTKEDAQAAGDAYKAELQKQADKEYAYYESEINKYAETREVDAGMLKKALSGTYGDYETLKAMMPSKRVRNVKTMADGTQWESYTMTFANEAEKLGDMLRGLTDEELNNIQALGAQAQRTATEVAGVDRQMARFLGKSEEPEKVAKATTTVTTPEVKQVNLGLKEGSLNRLSELGIMEFRAQQMQDRLKDGNNFTSSEEYQKVKQELADLLVLIQEYKGEVKQVTEAKKEEKKEEEATPVEQTVANASVLDMSSTLISGVSNIANNLETLGVDVPESMKEVINKITAGLSILQTIGSVIGVVQGLVTAITIRSLIPFLHTGGIVHAAQGVFVPGAKNGGIDTIPAMLSPGEMVLNEAQQSTLAAKLQAGSMVGGGHLVTRIKGGDILIALDNTNRSRGGSRGTYAYSK